MTVGPQPPNANSASLTPLALDTNLGLCTATQINSLSATLNTRRDNKHVSKKNASSADDVPTRWRRYGQTLVDKGIVTSFGVYSRASGKAWVEVSFDFKSLLLHLLV